MGVGEGTPLSDTARRTGFPDVNSTGGYTLEATGEGGTPWGDEGDHTGTGTTPPEGVTSKSTERVARNDWLTPQGARGVTRDQV